MTTFDIAYKETMEDEGLGKWTNDPQDPGGETFSGITRKNYPDWLGWIIIDQYKRIAGFPENLTSVSSLLVKVKEFYYIEYWKKPGFENVDALYPELAKKMFNIGVNVGCGTAAKWLQQTINLLNRNQKSYPDIRVDGGIGRGTISACIDCFGCNPRTRIMNTLKGYQAKHYIEWMERNPVHERFIGLLDRMNQ